jgi:hypothetical protein
MARSNRLLWIFLLVAPPALADQRQGATTRHSTKDATSRSGNKQPILADEHGTLVLPDEHGEEVLADEHGTLVIANELGTNLLADEHGTLMLAEQQVLADEHGTIVFEMPSAPRPAEPEQVMRESASITNFSRSKEAHQNAQPYLGSV